MNLTVESDALVIRPEDEQDRCWLQTVLGLGRDGDEARAVRCDVRMGFGPDAAKLHSVRVMHAERSVEGLNDGN